MLTCSTAFTAITRSAEGINSGVNSDLSFTVNSNVSGVFYSDANCTQQSNSFTIRTGTDSQVFYFMPTSTSSVDTSLTVTASTTYFDVATNTTSDFTAAAQVVAVAKGANYTVQENGTLSKSVSSSNINNVLYCVTVMPSMGTVSLNASTGAFAYTPTPYANGPDSFQFVLMDSQANTCSQAGNRGAKSSQPATVSITVTPVNQAPVASTNSVTVSTNINTAVSINLGISDVDLNPNLNHPVTDSLTYVMVTAPGNGSFNFSNFTYTPTTGFYGTDSFVFYAHDSFNLSTQNVTVTVTVNSRTPILTLISNLTGASENTDFQIPFSTLKNASNLSGNGISSNRLSFKITSIDSGSLMLNGSPVSPGAIFSSGDTLVWSPPANTFGNNIQAFAVEGFNGQLSSSPPVDVLVNVAALGPPGP